VIASDQFFTSRSEQLAALTLRHAVPTIYQYREFAVAGGLQSYGADVADTYRVAAQQAATRLLRSQPDFRVTHAEEAFPTRSRSSAIEWLQPFGRRVCRASWVIPPADDFRFWHVSDMFMGDRTIGFSSTGIIPLVGPAGTLVGTDRIHQDVDLITARISYRWGSPVVAQYWHRPEFKAIERESRGA
jgi:hypothetical protein